MGKTFIVTLSWGKADGAIGYRVWKRTGSGSPVKVAETQGFSHVFTDLVSPLSQYILSVSAVYANCESIKSGQIPQEPDDPTPPPEPCGGSPSNVRVLLSDTTGGGRQVAVLWDAVTGATGYKVWVRSCVNGTWGAWRVDGNMGATATWHKIDTLPLPMTNHIVGISTVYANCESVRAEYPLS